MNVGEANDVATVMRFVLQAPNRGGDIPTPEQAFNALVHLTARAEKALQLGLTPPDLEQRWPALVQALGAADRAVEPPR